MRLGIDIDNTITNTFQKMSEYSDPFSIKYNLGGPDYRKWPIEYQTKFLNEYVVNIIQTVTLKPDVIKYLELLHKNHKIYIITARSEHNSKELLKITIDYLKEKKIPHDKLIFSTNKLEIVKKEHIDLMIDDSYETCMKIRNAGYKALLFDSPRIKNMNMDKVSSWKEVYERIEGRV